MEIRLIILKVLFSLSLFTEISLQLRQPNRILDWFEGVELKLQCSNNQVFIDKLRKRQIKPSETDRTGDDYNIWTARPDKFYQDECFTTAFVGASLSYPKDKQKTKKWYPSIPVDGTGGNISVDFPSCHFPFKAKPSKADPQKTSYRCLDEGNTGQCWCSPTDDADRDQLYMLCPCAADRPGYQVHTIPRKELDSKRCRLPFKFEGKRYFTCTKDGHPEGKCWCKVNRFTNQRDYEYMKTALHPKLFQPADRDWGECPCPTTTVYGEFDNWQSWSSGCECRQSQHRVRSCKFPADLENPLKGLIPICFGQPTELKYCDCDYFGKQKFRYLDEMINIRELVKATPEFHKTGSLDFGNAKAEQSGIYYCTRSRVDKKWKWLDGKPGWSYRVNIVPERLIQTLLSGEDGESTDDIEKDLKLPIIQVEGWEMSVNWTDWVGCDRCNDRGEDKRIGFCIMKQKRGHKSKECLPKVIPCGGFKNFEDFDERKEAAAYIQIKRCVVTCDNDEVVRKITEPATGAGFPPLPKKARRIFIAPIVGSDLDLECADSDHLRPVSWYFFPYNKTGHKNLHQIPYDYSKVGTSLPNYRIAPTQVLVLKDIRFEDEGYYNCHVSLRLTVSYAIVPRHRNWAVVILSFLSYLTYSFFFGMVVIIFSVFYYNQFKKCSATGIKEGWTAIKESS